MDNRQNQLFSNAEHIKGAKELGYETQIEIAAEGS